MTTVKALTHAGDASAAVTSVADEPVRATYVKVRVHAVALNPTDWKHIAFMNSPGARAGCDVAGTVEEVGSSVSSAVKVGDRIAGVCHGGNASNHRDGAFAERAEIKDGLFVHIPQSMSFADGATLGVGVTTVGQALYQSLQLPLPAAEKGKGKEKGNTWVLVYGGASATGSLAVQFARLSGLRVVTTASARHHEWLQGLGAEKCFDYNDDNVGARIRQFTQDNLHYAFDTITNEQSMGICADALAEKPTADAPNHYSALMPPKGFPRDDCNTRYTMAYTAMGETYVKAGRTTEAKPQDLEYATMFWKLTEGLLEKGLIKTHPADERSGGLEKVNEGLKDLKEGNVRGKKVVYVL
jgi:NADPH:quinone reductase-like Zn-dependent oxidoreductase